MGVPLPQVAQFADSLARCLNANVGSAKCVELSANIFPPGRVREAFRQTKDRIESGNTFAEAFGPVARFLPGFFVPVVACGEAAGRLIPALRFIAEHSRRLSPVARKLHNAWYYLVIIVGSAWLIVTMVRVVALGVFAGLAASGNTVVIVGGAAAAFYFADRNPAARRKMHELSLAIPFLREVQQEWAVTIFTTAMALMYGTAVPARGMVRLAADAVANVILADRLRAAMVPIMEGSGFSQALSKTRLFPAEHLATLTTAEEAGELEQAFSRIAWQVGEKLYTKLSVFSAVVHRIVAYAAGLYVVSQIYFLVVVLVGRTQ
jgi:type II secretory pathway component PulF